jgi:hypothetical protein
MYYALIASLPQLEIGMQSPPLAKAFLNDCAQYVKKDELTCLHFLLHRSTARSSHPIAKTWIDIESQLSNALARLRAPSYKTDGKKYMQPHRGFRGDIEIKAAEAIQLPSPQDGERCLDELRWNMAEELMGNHLFGFSKLGAYAIQLNIVLRWQDLNEETGRTKLEEIIQQNTETIDLAEA